MNTTKPYLVRAIYEWCVDSHYTPYITVRVNGKTQVPMEFVKDGEIILNISQNATNDLVINNDYIAFMARFNGVSRKMHIPMTTVKGIFAKEVSQGLTFALEPDETSATEDKQHPDQPNLQQKQKNQQKRSRVFKLLNNI